MRAKKNLQFCYKFVKEKKTNCGRNFSGSTLDSRKYYNFNAVFIFNVTIQQSRPRPSAKQQQRIINLIYVEKKMIMTSMQDRRPFVLYSQGRYEYLTMRHMERDSQPGLYRVICIV